MTAPPEGVTVSQTARRRLRALAACLAGGFAVTGCGSGDSYDAAEAGLRDWLAAAAASDPGVCDLEAPGSGIHADLLRRHPSLGGPGTSCAERAGRMARIGLPPADAAMEVPAWDPSGEALVEARTDGGQVRSFWMLYADGRWLVSGEST